MKDRAVLVRSICGNIETLSAIGFGTPRRPAPTFVSFWRRYLNTVSAQLRPRTSSDLDRRRFWRRFSAGAACALHRSAPRYLCRIASCFAKLPASEWPSSSLPFASLGGSRCRHRDSWFGWQDDPEVDAWIVPIDPVPKPPFDRLLRIKYLRTAVTQLCYWPLLLRRTAQGGRRSTRFSASYTSFLSGAAAGRHRLPGFSASPSS
jgi:hypothetical protein